MEIDWWTLAFQAVNVLVLVALLGHFFFRPITEIVAKRQAAIASALAEADETRKTAEALKVEREAQLAGIAAERDRFLAEASDHAARQRQALMAAAQAEAAEMVEKSRSTMLTERAAMERAVADHATRLAVDIARRLAERVPPDALAAAFLTGLAREIAALPEDQRRRLATDDLHVVTAAPVGEAEERAVRDALRDALGGEVSVRLAYDPVLIAGLEVHSSGLVVRNTWRADLDRIRKEVEGGQRRAA